MRLHVIPNNLFQFLLLSSSPPVLFVSVSVSAFNYLDPTSASIYISSIIINIVMYKGFPVEIYCFLGLFFGLHAWICNSYRYE